MLTFHETLQLVVPDAEETDIAKWLQSDESYTTWIIKKLLNVMLTVSKVKIEMMMIGMMGKDQSQVKCLMQKRLCT